MNLSDVLSRVLGLLFKVNEDGSITVSRTMAINLLVFMTAVVGMAVGQVEQGAGWTAAALSVINVGLRAVTAQQLLFWKKETPPAPPTPPSSP